MRIRLRVPKDGEEKSGGFRDWFRWFRRDTSVPLPAPAPLPKPDNRWFTHAGCNYYFAGRYCKRAAGDWQSDYVFHVIHNGVLEKVRIVLLEPDVDQWEADNQRRISEASRLRIARNTLENLLELRRFPASITVSAEALAAPGL